MIKKLVAALRLFFFNPILFFAYLKKFFFNFFIFRFWHPRQKITRKVDGIDFELDFENFVNNNSLKEQVFDTYEPEVLHCIKLILKRGDIFVDVGANIGYFTAWGAALVGKEGQVHSFEPSPLIFNYLQQLSLRNPDYKIIVNPYAVGDKTGIFEMDYTDPLSGNNTFVPQFLEEHHIKKTGSIKVSMIRLDEYIKSHNLNNIALIKIDVEGYEFPVLIGMEGYFKSSSNRPIIICEIHPDAYPLQGYTLSQFMEYMKKYGYEAYDIYNQSRKIDITKLKRGINVVWRS
jgi:FkbM family methyltransferase